MRRALPVALFLVAGFARVLAAAGPSAVTEAESALDAFQSALAAGDRQGALERLGPEIVIFESGGAELSRDEYAQHHLAGDMEFLAATKTVRVDRRSGASGDLVWILTRSRTSGTYKGKEIASVGTETALLERSGDGWRIVHLHWSSHAAR